MLTKQIVLKITPLIWPLYFCTYSAFASTPEPVIEKIVLNFSHGTVKLNEEQKNDIRKQNNVLYNSNYIKLVYTDKNLNSEDFQLKHKTIENIKNFLLEESIPSSLISERKVTEPDEIPTISITASTVVILYEVPANFYNKNLPKLKNDPLCMKDTTLMFPNGTCLHFSLCDYLNKITLPEVSIIDDKSSSIAFSETPVMVNTRGFDKPEIVFQVEKDTNDNTTDEVWLPSASKIKATTQRLEFYLKEERIWIPSLYSNIGTAKANGRNYSVAYIDKGGYYRLMNIPDKSTEIIIVRAPHNMAFRSATMIQSAYNSWEGKQINGGTAVVFALPENPENWMCQFTVINATGEVMFSGEAAWTEIATNKYRIKTDNTDHIKIANKTFEIPQYGYQLSDDFDVLKSVSVHHIK